MLCGLVSSAGKYNQNLYLCEHSLNFRCKLFRIIINSDFHRFILYKYVAKFVNLRSLKLVFKPNLKTL